MAVDVPLFWNENLEPNIAGYKIYAGRFPGDYIAAGSPKDVGNVLDSFFTITATGDWFFAITARNTSAQESGFSAEVFFHLPVTMPVMSFMGGSGALYTRYLELGGVEAQTKFYDEGAVIRHPAGIWYKLVGGSWTKIDPPPAAA